MNELEKKNLKKQSLPIKSLNITMPYYLIKEVQYLTLKKSQTLTIFLSDTCKQGYKQLQVKNYPNIKPFMIHSQSLKLIILKFFLMKTLNKANKPELNVHLVFYN